MWRGTSCQVPASQMPAFPPTHQLPCSWCEFSHIGYTDWQCTKTLFFCILQVGSAQDGRTLGVPPMSPQTPPTVGAAVVPKLFLSLSVRSTFYAVHYNSFIQQLVLHLAVHSVCTDMSKESIFMALRYCESLHCLVSFQDETVRLTFIFFPGI